MGQRFIISFEDVERSVQEILVIGEEPAINRVRQQLGNRGSFTTISKHLFNIRGDKKEIRRVPEKYMKKIEEELHTWSKKKLVERVIATLSHTQICDYIIFDTPIK